ncbi:MAG: hypothetical protein HQM09_24370 [Candidatus Riflebacteria bacterium]|nr:hypothetical protein [Candidatus Riflebacteria bacterium]
METLKLQTGIFAKRAEIDMVLDTIEHGKFKSLRFLLEDDLENFNCEAITPEVYLRLCGWLHSSGNYLKANQGVMALCLLLFGYEIPEKIENFFLKDWRYGKATELVKNVIEAYHRKKNALIA